MNTRELGLRTKEVTVLPERVEKYGKWIPGTGNEKGHWEPIVIAAFKVKDMSVCSKHKATYDMKGNKIKRKKIPCVSHTSNREVKVTLERTTRDMDRSHVLMCDSFPKSKAQIRSHIGSGNPFEVVTPGRLDYTREQKKCVPHVERKL